MSPKTGESAERRERFVARLKAAHAGCDTALGELIESCRKYLLRVAASELPASVRPKVAPSDLVQESFLEAQRDFPVFRGQYPDELRAWLRQILRRNLANAIRRYQGTEMRRLGREVCLSELPGDSDWSPELAQSPDGHAAALEDAESVQRAMESLPAHYQEVLGLRHREHLGFAEIGQQMDRSTDAARKLWIRAVKALQRRLGRS